jgi:hypothetical protein
MSGLYACTGMQPGFQARWFHHEDHEGREEGKSDVNVTLFEYHTPPLLLFRESGSSFAVNFEGGGDFLATLSMAMPPLRGLRGEYKSPADASVARAEPMQS